VVSLTAADIDAFAGREWAKRQLCPATDETISISSPEGK
jgi:hypothetical protein